MFRLALPSLAVAALVVFVVSAQASTGRLTGQTGPGYSIQVKRAGKPVKTLKAGMYRITVEDKSSQHNFHLFGPGVNKKTSVAFTGETTWTVKLKPGRYTFQCDIHASLGMKGRLTVTK
jgi:Cupredoxin-like domain